MTAKQKIEALEKRIASLESQLTYLSSRISYLKARTPLPSTDPQPISPYFPPLWQSPNTIDPNVIQGTLTDKNPLRDHRVTMVSPKVGEVSTTTPTMTIHC